MKKQWSQNPTFQPLHQNPSQQPHLLLHPLAPIARDLATLPNSQCYKWLQDLDAANKAHLVINKAAKEQLVITEMASMVIYDDDDNTWALWLYSMFVIMGSLSWSSTSKK